MEPFIANLSRRRLALLLFGSLTFVVGGAWMGGAFGTPPDSDRYSPQTMFVIGWFAVLFFGLCATVFAKDFFATGVRLEIGPRGVCWHRWSDQTIPWSEIVDVGTWSVRRQKMIVLVLRDPAHFPGRGILGIAAKGNRALTGGDVCISLTDTDRSFDEAMAAMMYFGRQAAATAR